MMWERIGSRENIDLTTTSSLNLIFYSLAKDATRSSGEIFFDHIKDKRFTHYIGVNFDEVGRYTYKRYFNSPEKIKQYEVEGRLLIKEVEMITSFWKKKLTAQSDSQNLKDAFTTFRIQFEQINFIY